MKVDALNKDVLLPAVVLPSTSMDRQVAALLTWLRSAGSVWRRLLLQCGGILFRGFRVTKLIEFEQIVRAVSPKPLDYRGGNSPRTRVSTCIYTATEYPADQAITLHNELSYTQSWPTQLLFWCEVPPPLEGGETPIIDCRLALELLPRHIVNRFVSKELIYLHTLHGGVGLGRSWQATFETEDRSTVEEFLSVKKTKFEWTSTGSLKIRYHRGACETHPTTGEKVWFNQADQWHPSNLDDETRRLMEQLIGIGDFPHNVVFGDGSAIPDDDVLAIRETLWGNAVVFRWEAGDVVLLDNMIAAHGRRPFRGPRKVYVAMG